MIQGRPFMWGSGLMEAGRVVSADSGTILTKRVLEFYVEQLQKTTVNDIHGGLVSVNTAGTITPAGGTAGGTIGLSRVLFVAKAGVDSSGTFTITGTSIDRSTGAPTIGDSEIITVEGLSTDNTSPGSVLANLWDFDQAYISAKWWSGAVTILAGATVNLSNVDTYSIAYEQFDNLAVTINSIDHSISVDTISGDLEIQPYKIVFNGNTVNSVDLKQFARMALTAPTISRYYRLRRGDLALALNCPAGDGFFIQAQPSSNRTYKNWSSKLWYTASLL